MTVLTPEDDVEQVLAASRPGWPRALVRVPWKVKPLPLPWINAIAPLLKERGWVEMDGNRWRDADDHGLCFCCGEPLRGTKVLGRHGASWYSAECRHMVWLTDGPPGHPRCIALAARHCPHLRGQHQGDEDFVIALAWTGDGVGYVEVPPEHQVEGAPRLLVHPHAKQLTLAQLRAYASADPLGEAPPVATTKRCRA